MNAIIIPMPTGTNVLLAVNVDPVVEGPVGARSGSEQDAWLFPVREMSHTKYLKPHELPMFMTPKVRRTLLLLDCIRENASVKLWVQPTGETVGTSRFANHVPGPLRLDSLDAWKGEVDLSRNSFNFVMQDTEHRNGQYAVGVPLTDVEDIWQAPNGKWNIRLGGRLDVDRHPSKPWEVFYCPVVR